MIRLTIKCGFQEAFRDYTIPPTVGQIKADSTLKMELGYGDNIKVIVGGVEQPDHATLHGGLITIETAANKKA